jgi:hypothetical protein
VLKAQKEEKAEKMRYFPGSTTTGCQDGPSIVNIWLHPRQTSLTFGLRLPGLSGF